MNLLIDGLISVFSNASFPLVHGLQLVAVAEELKQTCLLACSKTALCSLYIAWLFAHDIVNLAIFLAHFQLFSYTFFEHYNSGLAYVGESTLSWFLFPCNLIFLY